MQSLQPVMPGAAAPTFTRLPPLSLYVHVPWCVRKCPYCDFNSHEPRGEIPEREYVAALLRDLETALPDVWGRPVQTVFIGGGTPSLLSVEALDALLSGIRARLPLAADAEITLEANPGTVEAEKFAGFRAAGINRLSLGIQSFNDAHLRALGRIHDAAEAATAVALALRHFDNVNLDLMYGLPGQSPEDAEADIDKAIAFGPAHLSAYHLTIEPHTWFAHHPPVLPEHDVVADMQGLLESRLAVAGYRHYEIAAFSRDGKRCRHNLNYWQFGDYLGIGAGAHGKISFKNSVVRDSRPRSPAGYLAVAGQTDTAARSRVPPADLPGEFMMNALRLVEGFDLSLFTERTSLSTSLLFDTLSAAEAQGLIRRDALRLIPTERGRHFLNDLMTLFLADAS